MKYAWVEDGKIRDICHGNPVECYTPQIAALYNAEIGDDIKVNATYDGHNWVNQVIPERTPIELTPPPRLWVANDIRSAMTLLERVKWDNDQSGMIVTAKLETASYQTLETIAPVLQMLVDSGDITQETMNKVLA